MAKRRSRRLDLDAIDLTQPKPVIQEPRYPKFEFKTQSQVEAWEVISENTVIFLAGPAGCGKTTLATAWANQEVSAHRFNRVIHTRPIVESQESLGWLPGTVEEKLGPYMSPIRECSRKTQNAGIQIDTLPLAYMRGATFVNSVCILDEAQNATKGQLKLYLTRLGDHSKMILCGDSDQSDIRDSGFLWAMDSLRGIPGVGFYEFSASDSVRHPLVVKMIERMDPKRV